MFRYKDSTYASFDEAVAQSKQCWPESRSMMDNLFASLHVASSKGLPSKQTNKDLILALVFCCGYSQQQVKRLKTKLQKRYELVKWFKRSQRLSS